MTVVLLSPTQVADRLNLARSTIAKLRLVGGGPPFVKLGAAVRYPEDLLIEWIDAQPVRNSTSRDESTHGLRRRGRRTSADAHQPER
jgi:hypothetical protein